MVLKGSQSLFAASCATGTTERDTAAPASLASAGSTYPMSQSGAQGVKRIFQVDGVDLLLLRTRGYAESRQPEEPRHLIEAWAARPIKGFPCHELRLQKGGQEARRGLR